jgi:hypothetical protein
LESGGVIIKDENMSEGIVYNAAMLYKYGLPIDNAKQEDMRHVRVVVLHYGMTLEGIDTAERMCTWQCHMGRCGGDGRRLQARGVMKKYIKSCTSNVHCLYVYYKPLTFDYRMKSTYDIDPPTA